MSKDTFSDIVAHVFREKNTSNIALDKTGIKINPCHAE